MKTKIPTLAIFVLAMLTLATVTNAAVLRSDAGPYYRSSFNNTWQSGWGYNFPTTAIGTNYVDFDIQLVKVGNPLSSGYYDIKVTVLDLNSPGSFYYTANLSGVTGSAHRQALVFVPTTGMYNITIWVSSSQSPSSDYWQAKITNIVVSN